MIWISHARSGRLLFRLVLISFLCMALLCVAAFFYIPIFLKKQATQAIQQQLGESAELEGIDVSIGDASLTFNGFALSSEETADSELVSFSFEALRLQFRSIWEAIRGNPEVIGVSVVRPQAVIQGGERVPINFSSFMERDGRLLDDIGAALPLEVARIENGRLEIRQPAGTIPPVLLLDAISAEVHGLPQVVEEGRGELLVNIGSRYGAGATPLLMSLRGRFTEGDRADFDIAMSLEDLDVAQLVNTPDSPIRMVTGAADAELQGVIVRGHLNARLNFQLQRTSADRNPSGQRPQVLGYSPEQVIAHLNQPNHDEMTANLSGDMTDPDFDLIAAIEQAVAGALRQEIAATQPVQVVPVAQTTTPGWGTQQPATPGWGTQQPVTPGWGAQPQQPAPPGWGQPAPRQ